MSRKIQYSRGAWCDVRHHEGCTVAWLAQNDNMTICDCPCHTDADVEVPKESFNTIQTWFIPVLSGDRIVRVDNYPKPE